MATHAAALDLALTPPRVVYSSFAGGVFGSLCWMPIMAFVARDYWSGVATVLFALVVYAGSVRAALRSPRAFFRVGMAQTAAVASWTFAVVNWRWDAWMAAYRLSSLYQRSSDLPLWAVNVLLAALFGWILLRLAQLDRRQKGMSSSSPPPAAGAPPAGPLPPPPP